MVKQSVVGVRDMLQDEGTFLSDECAPLSRLLQRTQGPAPTAGVASHAPGPIACAVSAAPGSMVHRGDRPPHGLLTLPPRGHIFSMCHWCSTCGTPCHSVSLAQFLSNEVQGGMVLISAIPPCFRVLFASYCQSLISPDP